MVKQSRRPAAVLVAVLMVLLGLPTVALGGQASPTPRASATQQRPGTIATSIKAEQEARRKQEAFDPKTHSLVSRSELSAGGTPKHLAGSRPTATKTQQPPSAAVVKLAARTKARQAFLPAQLRVSTLNPGKYKHPLTRAAAQVTGQGHGGRMLASLAPTTGTISGHITDLTTGAPIANTCVDAYGDNDTGTVVHEACTNATGDFVLTGLNPDNYYVTVEDHHLSHLRESRGGLAVSAGLVTTADFALQQGGSIAGSVTAAAGGAPLAHACFTVYDTQDNYVDAGACTAADGTYQTTGVPTGVYRLYVEPDYTSPYIAQWLGGTSFATATSVSVTSPQITSGQNAALTRGGTISGTVTGADGLPVVGLEVDVFDLNNLFLASGGTAADGTYTTNGLPATGDYVVWFSNKAPYVGNYYAGATTFAAAQHVHVVVGTNTPGINGVLALGGSIAGHVTAADTGAPLAGICAYAYASATGFYSDAACSSADGSYVISGLTTGSYAVSFDGGTTAYLGASRVAPVSVTQGQSVTGIDQALQRGASITGHVTRLSNGSPVQNACVSADGPDSVYGCTDANGAYLLQPLHAGSYVVRFTALDLAAQYFDHADLSTSATAVTLTQVQSRTGVDAALKVAPRVTGHLTEAGTGAVVRGCITARTANSNGFGSVCTDSLGAYNFPVSMAGTYTIEASPSTDDHLTSFYGGSTQASATQVPLTFGQTFTANVAVPKSSKLTGTITAQETGAPLAGLQVKATSSTFHTFYAYTNAQGVYEVRGLLPSTYELVVDGGVDRFGVDEPNIPVGSEAVVTRNYALAPAATIAGTISPAAASSCVNVETSSGVYVAQGCADASGAYVAGPLHPGSYLVHAYGNDDYLSRYFGGTPTTSGATTVTITGTTPRSGINITLPLAGHISGTITDSRDSLPVGDVCVYAYLPSDTFSSVASTCSNPDGTYALGGLETGDYVLQFTDSAGRDFLEQWARGKATAAQADLVHATSGSTTTGVNAALQHSGSVSGITTDAVSGLALADVCVSAYLPSNIDTSVSSSCSGADGSYRVTGLTTGSYLLKFEDFANGHLTQWASGKPTGQTADFVSVTTGGNTPGINASLARGGRISGSITYPGGVDGYGCAEVYDANKNYLSSSCTRSSGNVYTTQGLASGTYYVYFFGSGIGSAWQNQPDLSTATPISVVVGSITGGINGAITGGQGTIGGSVTDTSGLPVSSEDIQATETTTRNTYFAFTTDTGAYTLSGLPAGTYHVQAAAHGPLTEEWYGGTATYATATDVPVTAGAQVAGINLQLDPGVQVTGLVRDAATGTPLPGHYVSGNVVTNNGDDSVYGFTDQSGRYTLPALRPGGVTLNAAAFDGDPYLADYYRTAPGGPAATYNVGASPGPDANIGLTRGATVSGTVLDRTTGSPVSGICVHLNSAGSFYSSNGNYDCTDSAGNYHTSGVASGSYTIAFENPNGRYLTTYLGNTAQPTGASTVTLTNGVERTGTNATVVLGGVLSGTVTQLGSATGIPGVCVALFDAATGAAAGSAGCTGASGTYAGLIAPGSYKVLFSDPAGVYTDQYFNHVTTLAAASSVTVTGGGSTANVNGSLSSAPRFTASAPRDPVLTTPYSYTFTATGNPAPTFSVASGALPAGLSLSSGGVLSGTVTTPTPATFTVAATNSAGTVATASLTVQPRFTDVPATHQFASDIYWLANAKITTGFADGSFRPAGSVTRQAFAAYLYRYAHAGVDAGMCAAGTSPFTDVADTSQFCGDIKWLAGTGITGGFPDHTFRPNNVVTRQAVAAFLYRYNHGGADAGVCPAGTSAFPDVADSSVFCGDIKWLATTTPMPITGGFADGTFRPGNTVTRQATAAYFHRYNTDFPPAPGP